MNYRLLISGITCLLILVFICFQITLHADNSDQQSDSQNQYAETDSNEGNENRNESESDYVPARDSLTIDSIVDRQSSDEQDSEQQQDEETYDEQETQNREDIEESEENIIEDICDNDEAESNVNENNTDNDTAENMSDNSINTQPEQDIDWNEMFLSSVWQCSYDDMINSLRNGADTNYAAPFEPFSQENNLTAVHLAAYNGCGFLLNNLILEYEADINSRDSHNRTPLMYSLIANNTETFSMLMDYNADPDLADDNSWTALLYAAKYQNLAAIEILLEKNVDINAIGTLEVEQEVINVNAFLISVCNDNLEIAQLLLENDIETNINGSNNNSPLHIAVMNDNLDMVQLLIENNAEIDAVNNEERTPLHIAAKKGNNSITQYLINNNADISAVDELGNTPLILATRQNHLEVVQTLIESGADIFASDTRGYSMVWFAIANRCMDILNYVIDNQLISINYICLIAIILDDAAIVQHSIENGADLYFRDGNNKTFADYAQELNRTEIYALIQQYIQAGPMAQPMVIYYDYDEGHKYNIILDNSQISVTRRNGEQLFGEDRQWVLESYLRRTGYGSIEEAFDNLL